MKNKIDINRLIDEKTILEIAKELNFLVTMDFGNGNVQIEGKVKDIDNEDNILYIHNIYTIEEFESLTYSSAEELVDDVLKRMSEKIKAQQSLFSMPPASAIVRRIQYSVDLSQTLTGTYTPSDEDSDEQD